MKKILVYGWYSHNNIGDELFKVAFQKLFPSYTFIFVDKLTIDILKDASAIFFGGGSFLFGAPNMDEGCLPIIKSKPIFYIGVGAETEIHPIHISLMKIAKVIAIRSTVNFDKILKINSNTIVIPDIVYALNDLFLPTQKKSKSVLIFPNIFVIPNNTDPHWRFNAWDHFKFEFSQFIDHLIDHGHSISFFSMCTNKYQKDDNAAIELINSMKHRHEYTIHHDINIIPKFEFIITQRYHGAILSEITNIPYISIYHHDKLKNTYYNNGKFVSFYSSAKQTFIDNFNYTHKNIAIETDIFEDLKIKVTSVLKD